MTDIDLVQWNGVILKSSQGLLKKFVPGARQRVHEIVPMVRSDVELAKVMGIAGCDHTANMTFLHVEDVRALVSDIEAFTTLAGEGKLTVDGYGDYNNCILISHSFGDIIPEAYGLNITGGQVASSRRYTVPVTMIFHQLR